MPLLHGILHVHVHEAVDIATTVRIKTVGFLKKYVCCGMLPELSGSCDPYLCLDVGSTRRLRTRIVAASQHPVWNEKHEVYLADEAEELKIEVKVGCASSCLALNATKTNNQPADKSQRPTAAIPSTENMLLL